MSKIDKAEIIKLLNDDFKHIEEIKKNNNSVYSLEEWFILLRKYFLDGENALMLDNNKNILKNIYRIGALCIAIIEDNYSSDKK
jgi:hypothetical protein